MQSIFGLPPAGRLLRIGGCASVPGMDTAPAEKAASRPKPSRLGLYAACTLSALAFGWLFVGWLRPDDPLAAVAVVNHPHPWLMVVLLAGLSVLLAGVTGVGLAGGRPYAGLVAVAVGWAVLRVRGGGIEAFVFQWAPQATAEAGRSVPFLMLMLETLIWSGMGLLVVATCQWLQARRSPFDHHRPTEPEATPGHARPAHKGTVAGPAETAGWWELRRTVLCAALAVIVICLASGPVTSRPQAGQPLFAIALGFFVGALLAQAIKPPAHLGWCFLAVPLVALIGYGLACCHPGLGMQFVSLPNPVPNLLARALPIDYLAAGLSGCVLARWTGLSRSEPKSP